MYVVKRYAKNVPDMVTLQTTTTTTTTLGNGGGGRNTKLTKYIKFNVIKITIEENITLNNSQMTR